MINPQQLLQDLQRLLPEIEQDILAYSEAQLSISTHLQEEYAKAIEAKRTAEHFVDWRAAQIYTIRCGLGAHDSVCAFFGR